MKLSFLDGPSTAKKIRKLMTSCTQLDIAMAYVKIGGLRGLLKSFDELVERGASLRIVFGLSSRQGITDIESAEGLLRLSKNRNVNVRRWNNPGFHPKLFIFHSNNPSVLVGSSNLTNAARSTNAEANVLVEDAEATFWKEATDFFEHYFEAAPVLKRKDLAKYRHRTFKRKREYVGPSEDRLPSPATSIRTLEAIRPRNIWKLAPGKDAWCWDEWLSVINDEGEGIIAIGWDEVGDLNNFKSRDSLRQKVAQKAKEIWDRERDRQTKVGYVTNQLWMFKNDISVGDIIIVYSESRVFGVAEVTEESEYKLWREKSVSFGHQINVRYWWCDEWPNKADHRIIDTLGRQGTLRLVSDDWFWDYLLKRLS